MKKSNIAKGQMFVQFPQPISELQETPKPRVWVKVSEYEGREDLSVFIDNDALVGFSIGAVKQFGIMDRWLISDNYYNDNVKAGKFVPIDDLREVEEICNERGCELPESRYL